MRATALVLAGGRASRMNGKAKCLLPLGDGRSILEHLVEQLAKVHIDVVVLGSLPDDEIAAWGGSEVVFLPDAEQYGGTGHAIAGSASLLNHRRTERLLICYGDTFLPNFDYRSACYPETLTIGRTMKFLGNVHVDGEGAKYEPRKDTRVPCPWIELGASCIRYDQLSDVGKFRGFPDWLETQTFRRICIHDGLVLTTGDPGEYEVARSWTP